MPSGGPGAFSSQRSICASLPKLSVSALAIRATTSGGPVMPIRV